MPLWLIIIILIGWAWLIGAAVFWALCASSKLPQPSNYWRFEAERQKLYAVPDPPIKCQLDAYYNLPACEDCQEKGICIAASQEEADQLMREKLWQREFRPFDWETDDAS